MILGKGEDAGKGVTLDSLFRRAGVRSPERLALVDPPDREHVIGGAPRALTFSQADKAISALAGRLQVLGLPTDAVIAIQLGNIVESVISLLAVLRAGMIAAPLPLLWREQDMLAALACVGTKAIITADRIGTVPHAEIASRAAAELFCIRHVCAFGADIPDGVAPLDDVFANGREMFIHPPPRKGNAAAHAAVVTFENTEHGIVPVARHHGALVAGGLAIALETALGPEASILTTIVPGSFAALALSVVPWLLGGGTLHLHHAFDWKAFADQIDAVQPGIVVVPGPALPALSAVHAFDRPELSVAALWRAPERLGTAECWNRPAPLVDVAVFGEWGFVIGRRGIDGLPTPLPQGAVTSLRSDTSAPHVIETRRSARGTLLLRGTMVPRASLPPWDEQLDAPPFSIDADGFLDTGFGCRRDDDRNTLVITAAPAGTANVGGYRFREHAIESTAALVNPEATITALPDALLGQRLAGSAPASEGIAAALAAQGVNPLVAGAFRRAEHG